MRVFLTSLSFRFKSVNMRYREELPLVLKDVSFKVNSEEKIGIVGRTGSGEFLVLDEAKI